MPSVPEYFKDLAIGATRLPRRNPRRLLEDIFRPRSPSPSAALQQWHQRGNDLGGRQRSGLDNGREREREPEEVEPVVAGGRGTTSGGGGRREAVA